MIIKEPVAYDTSYWEIIPDFALVSPRPLYVATKATEGLTGKDSAFVRYFTDLGYDGIRRGAYHFFRKAYSATEQAKHYCNVVRPYVTDRDVLEMDFEEGGETAAQLLEYLRYVKSQFPRNLIMIYSRRLLMDAVVMTAAQKAEMKQYPVWVAGYPTNPDSYNFVPGFYIPDPTRWGPVWMWQYSENGSVQGIQGEVDLNWLASDFITWLSDAPQPVTQEYQRIRRYESDCHVLVIDPRVQRVRVTDTRGSLVTVRAAAVKAGAKYAINADMWDKLASFPHYPDSLAVSDGFQYHSQFEGRPFLNVSADGTARISSNDYSNLYNTASGVRYIVRAGQCSLDQTRSDYTAIRDPRTAAGIRADGKLVFVVVDGRSAVSAGVTLTQLANILVEFEALAGMDFDGGGSSTLCINGVVVNVPMDIDGVSRERAVINHVLIGDNAMTAYEVVSDTYVMSLRVDHNSYATKLESVPVNTVMKADSIWTATVTGTNVKAGDRWAHIVSINGAAKDGWVAVVHLGAVYCTVKEIAVPEPAPVPTLPDVLYVATKADMSDRVEYRKAA